MKERKKKILFITPGIYFNPDQLIMIEKFKWLSKKFSGHILSVAHKREYCHMRLHDFEFHGVYLPRFMYRLQDIYYCCYVLAISIYIYFFKGGFDIIFVQDAFKTGLLALILSKITGRRFIVEVIGNFEKSFSLNLNNYRLKRKIKLYFAKIISPVVMKKAHGIKILYPGQINKLKKLNKSYKIYCFHDFVPISIFKTKQAKNKYILFVGGPWFLKGVDILIKAFIRISNDFPEYKLKIVGYSPDRSYFEKLAGSNDKINFSYPKPYNEIIELMEGCEIFVLPSRAEAMGRVLLEAMASKKPIIASNVDGIPTYVKNGYNGLIFESENIDDLVEKIKIILNNENYAKQIAKNGYEYVQRELSEKVYLEKFECMVEEVLK